MAGTPPVPSDGDFFWHEVADHLDVIEVAAGEAGRTLEDVFTDPVLETHLTRQRLSVAQALAFLDGVARSLGLTRRQLLEQLDDR